MKRIFISGKTDGDFFLSRANFAMTEEELKIKGWAPVNPIRICSSSWSRQRCMRERIRALAGCDAIYMMANWRQSVESKLEHFIALKLGMEIRVENQSKTQTIWKS